MIPDHWSQTKNIENLTLLVTVGSCLATAIRWPRRVLVLNSLNLTLVALVHSWSVLAYEKLLALGRLLTRDTTIWNNKIIYYYLDHNTYNFTNNQQSTDNLKQSSKRRKKNKYNISHLSCHNTEDHRNGCQLLVSFWK